MTHSYAVGDILYLEYKTIKTIFRVKKVSDDFLHTDFSITYDEESDKWVRTKSLNIKLDVQMNKLREKLLEAKEFSSLSGFENAKYVKRYALPEEIELLLRIYS